MAPLVPGLLTSASSAAVRPAISQSVRSVGSTVPQNKNFRVTVTAPAAPTAAAPPRPLVVLQATDVPTGPVLVEDYAVTTEEIASNEGPEDVVNEAAASAASACEAGASDSQVEAASTTNTACSAAVADSAMTSTSTSAAACCSASDASGPADEPASSSSQPSTSAPPSVVSSMFRSPKDHNSVTIKHDTRVKDAAGAIFKVIDRLGTAFVTAIRVEPTHEALNRAVKSIAVAHKYVNDNVPGHEVTFLPFNRVDNRNSVDHNLFGFLVFKTVINQALKLSDQTDLNVSKSSDVNKMANAVISIVLDREQAVMKAGGSSAIYVAMSAIINARKRLQARHGLDLMLVPSFITEDTSSTLGRESKFLRFNILKCEPNGPKSDVHPSVSSYEGPYAMAHAH